jgi:Flp pilus assembly protein TadG
MFRNSRFGTRRGCEKTGLAPSPNGENAGKSAVAKVPVPIFSRRRRGASMLELVVTLPMFLTMTVGIIEFGRGFMVQQMVTNAAREGARHGILPGAKNSDVEAKVKEYLATGSIDPAVVQVTVTPANLQAAKTGAQVKVVIRINYTDVTWMPAPWFMGNTSLSSDTVMRRE